MSTKLKKPAAFLVSLFILFSVGVTLVQAQPGGNPPGGGNPIVVPLRNPFGESNNSLFTLLRTIINNILLPIGGIIAVMAFIYSGFLYVVAQGNETKLKIAHKSLLYTSIGTAVLLGSWVLANVVCRTIASLGGPACPI